MTSESIIGGLQVGAIAAAATPVITASTPIATKIIEVVSKGIGTAYSPINTLLNQKAQVAGLKGIKEIIGDIDGDITIKKGDFEITLNNSHVTERAIKTMIDNTIKQQLNIEDIANRASQIIESKVEGDYSKISEEEVIEDWAIRFFDLAKNIRDDEMKNLWSEILAGEIISPGSYSLRTLEVLKNISKKEAELFCKLVNISFESAYIFVPKNNDLLIKYDFTLLKLIDLEELNLIQRDLIYTIGANEEKATIFGENTCIVIKNNTNKKINIPIIKLTNVGREISKLVTRNNEFKHIENIAESIRNINPGIEVYYTDLIERLSDGRFIYSNNLFII